MLHSTAVQYLKHTLLFLFTTMCTIKFCSVVFNVISSLHVTNKIHWCVVLHRLSPVINKCCRLLLPVMSVINVPRSGCTLFTIPDGYTIDNMWWSKVLVKISEKSNFSHLTCIRHPHSGPHQKTAISLVWKKLEWCGYPTVNKVSGYDYSFWYNT